MSLSEEQFGTLLANAKSGNQDSLLELVLQYQSPLASFVEKQLGQHLANVMSEEDVLQETFVQALKSIVNFHGTNQLGFVAWLKAIATNRIRDAARKAASVKRGGGMNQVINREQTETRAFDLINELSGDGYTPSFFAARHEAVNALNAALVVLPEEQREAIRLHCFEKFTLDQTAKQMNRSKDSVRGLIQRGKQALRNSLEASSKWFSQS